MSVVGFDIGNENSYIAAVKSGGIEILDNEYSLRSTPTYVAFTEHSRDIGVSAKAKLVTNIENTVFGFKRILGKKNHDSETQNELSYLPYSVCELSSGGIGIKVNYFKSSVIFSIEQLMAMMLTKLKMIAETKLGNKIRDCVIAVPVYYTDIQRRAMLDAASIAGLNALKLMNESTAIALSYGYFKQDLTEQECRNVLFVDVGNSSTTVTACAFSKDSFKILGCVWDDVGGRDLDNVLVQHFVNDFKNRFELDARCSKKALLSLMHECESLKKVMSANSLEVSFQIECFMQDKDVSGKIKREDFETLSAHVFNKIKRTLCRILSEVQLKPQDIYSVELVGGTSRVPEVKRLIREVYSQEPNSTLNQDEAVARGCALQCALLSPSLKTRNFIIEDMPSYSIKIVWKNMECKDEELEIFSPSDKIPAFKAITLCMSKPFTLIAFSVDSYPRIYKIGSFTFGNIPQDAEECGFIKIKVKAFLDIHAIFSLVSAKTIPKSHETEQDSKVSTDQDLKDEKIDTTSIPTVPTSDKDGTTVLTSDKDGTVDSRSIVKFTGLTITSDVSSSKTKLDEFISAEKQMIRRDIEKKEKADARNALEEFIYEIRGKLSYELRDFLQDEDRKTFLQSLEETQDWIYENEDDAAVEYFKRLREFQHLYDPVNKRYVEWEERSAILDEYSQALQQALNILHNFEDEKYPDTFRDEIEYLRNIWQNSEQYLKQATDKFSELKKYQDVPLTTEDLRKVLMQFKSEFQSALFKLEKKVNAPKVSTSSGDSTTKDPKNSDEDESKLQGQIEHEQPVHNE